MANKKTPKLQKGSREAKEHMAKLRAMKGQAPKKGGMTDALDEFRNRRPI